MVNGKPGDGASVKGIASSELQIRRAVSADAPMLARLRYDFRRELDPVEEPEDAFLRRCTGWMSDRLQQGGAWRCFVALHRDGMAAASLIFSATAYSRRNSFTACA